MPWAEVGERLVPTLRIPAKAPRRQPGVMNKTERRYADLLFARQHASEVADYWFEAVTFKVAHDTRYTPDFLVQLMDGTLECHEVKGFRRDDAMVKIRTAAAMFPFRFVLVEADGKGWKFTEIQRP